MPSPPPLTNLRVLEFAGLAPGPYAGLLLADYGASVLRIDRPHPAAHTTKPPPPTPDSLTRHKSSIALDVKSPQGLALLKALLPHVDVLIDPFRPGVLEKLGLDPHTVLLATNPRLIVARMTGFRRDGKYKDMAGHDINYIAVSGVLSMLGAAGAPPSPPGNLLGDFAGGGAVCFMGILLALLARARTGRGQVVAANMVDGSAHLASMPRFAMQTPMWDQARGTNVLDGGAPYYGVYETKDGRYMSVGALEPQFYAALLKGLALPASALPSGDRLDRQTWPALRKAFTKAFASRSRKEWEAVFDGTDACVAPVLGQAELQAQGWRQRPIVALEATPGRAVGGVQGAGGGAEGQGEAVQGAGWYSRGLRPGQGGEEVLEGWVGWRRGRDFEVESGGLVLSKGRARL